MARDVTTPAGRRETAIAAVVAAALAIYLALALGPAAAPAGAACAHAGAHAHDVTLPKLRKAITCVINHERARRGRASLAPNTRLKLAAQSHTNRMLATDCLRHKCPGEP